MLSDVLCVFSQWVQIVAGLVDTKLFSVPDEDIQVKCNDTLGESANRVIEHLLDQVIFDDKDIFEYFEPLLTSFLTTPVEEENNSHFTFTGSSSGPDFILREQKLLDAKFSDEQKKAGYVTLMHSNAMSLSSQGQSKQQRTSGLSLGGGQSSSLRGGLVSGSGAARKGGIKSVSLSQVGR